MSESEYAANNHFLELDIDEVCHELDYDDTPPAELLRIQKGVLCTWQLLDTDSEIEMSTVDTTSEIDIQTKKKVETKEMETQTDRVHKAIRKRRSTTATQTPEPKTTRTIGTQYEDPEANGEVHIVADEPKKVLNRVN